MDLGKKRFTIGLLVSGITEHFIISICKGVMLAAKEADVEKVAKKDLFHFQTTSGERWSVVCLPLFSNEMLYGLLICDLTSQLFDNGEFLANQLGSAVKMIDLLRTNESIQQKLEESLTALKENITVSVGIYLMKADENLTLHDALSHADASLYEAKKNRIKSVAKESGLNS